jgi:hypothetical protein
MAYLEIILQYILELIAAEAIDRWLHGESDDYDH